MNDFINISTNAQIASALLVIAFLLLYIAFKDKSKRAR